jgi:hypothetical protein
VATFHIEAQGNLGNRMIQFLVAKALEKHVPGLVISNSVMPAWKIDYPEVEHKGRIFHFDEPQNVPFAVFRELFSRGLADCIRYSGYGQRVENFPPWREASTYFRNEDVSVGGFSSEYLVINIRGGEILDGRHAGYVLVPVDFYVELVRRTGLKPIFMGQIGDNIYCEALHHAFPHAPFIPSGGVMHDFELLRRSVNLVPAISTFSWLACWLSETAENIFMPMTGLFNPLQNSNHDFAPTNDKRFRFFWFPANYAGRVEDSEKDHAPIRGRSREIDATDLSRMKSERKLQPKLLENYAVHFDELYYCDRYEDVRVSLANGMGSGFLHYIGWGFRENRHPIDIDMHWYVRTYPDAAHDIGLGIYEDPLHHYISIGAAQAYRPVPPAETENAPADDGMLPLYPAPVDNFKAQSAGHIYRLRTFHGTELVADLESGEINHGKSDAQGHAPVFGYRPAEASFLFITAELPLGRLPVLRGQEAVSRLVPMHTTRTAHDGSVACYVGERGRFLLGAPPTFDRVAQPMVFGSEIPNDYERIYLEPASGPSVPAHLREAVPLIDQWVAEGSGAAALHSLLARPANDAVLRDVLNAAGLLLSASEWASLGEKLLAAEPVLPRIEARFPADLFAQHALRPVVEWVRGQRGNANGMSTAMPKFGKLEASRGREIGPSFDCLDRIGIKGEYVSFPASCAISVRRAALPRRRAAILATARNEGLYILDWLAHHRAIGFDDFFIYSNDNIDHSDALLQALAEAGEIHWVRSVVRAGTRPQWKAYHHALSFEPAILDYKWTLAIDLDEYFELNTEYFRSVSDYLSWAECHLVDSIALNWVMVGSNGHTRWSDEPMRKRFPVGRSPGQSSSHASELAKAIFRTARFPMSFPHHPVPYRAEEPVFKTAAMRPLPYDPGQGASFSPDKNVHLAWISHFFFKSNEEFVFKFSRQRGDDLVAEGDVFAALTPHFVRSFVAASQQPRVLHTPDVVDVAAEGWRARYHQLPGVREAMQQIRAFYADRLGNLLAELQSSQAVREAGEAGETFLLPLLTGASDYK